jgi:hypothetical protein
MNALFFLLLAEAFVFAAIWHNESLRSERGKPDPAVLFSHRSAIFRKPARSVKTIAERPPANNKMKSSMI